MTRMVTLGLGHDVGLAFHTTLNIVQLCMHICMCMCMCMCHHKVVVGAVAKTQAGMVEVGVGTGIKWGEEAGAGASSTLVGGQKGCPPWVDASGS